ncbi:toxin-antitoxin system YwqK family antitoxin [Tenacibaculum ascidiaceicola]|uniref:toxin-antitoxin system YwqK family antitoxin n=1 Tax=Tenacibaculum ascidiaceicola TaxID=1699411 RepID=UPI003895D366
MKIRHLLPLFVIFSSCKDDVYNEKYRNENYVFYQEDDKAGKWKKINPKLEIKLPKSHSTYFFPNGNRYAELEVLDSFPNRIIKYFNKQDELIRTVTYKSDSMVNKVFENGYYKGYHSNLGLLQSEGLIENHLYQGKWKFYHKDGKTIKQIVEYVNDTLHGMREDYWENGNLKSTVNIIKGKHNGESLHYYESGNLKERNNQKNGVFYGSMIKYYKNKNVESERKYWNDKLIDSCKTYYENGQLRLLQFFDLDTISMKKSGMQINYYPNGKIEAELVYEENIANIKRYYESGELEEISTKKNNQHHGQVTVYYKNGNKKIEGIAKNGYYDGKFKFFNKSGELEKTVNYNLGEALDSIMY